MLSFSITGLKPVSGLLNFTYPLGHQLGLISLLRSDKPDVKARLQLVKDGKALLVEVVKVSDKNEIIANIIPNQEKAPKLAAGDEVACGVLAAAAQ